MTEVTIFSLRSFVTSVTGFYSVIFFWDMEFFRFPEKYNNFLLHRSIKAALGISGVSTCKTLWSKRGNGDEKGTQIDLSEISYENDIVTCE